MFKCRGEGGVMNADLVGVFNILKKVAKTIIMSVLSLSEVGNWSKLAKDWKPL